MNTPSISCYRYLNAQRIDGRLTIRKDALHFEADFPSQHRLYLPLHQLLGLEHGSTPSLFIRTLSEFGTVTFFPIDQESLDFIGKLSEAFVPNRQPLWSSPLTVTPQTTNEESTLRSYLEGQCSIDSADFTACSVQIHKENLTFLQRDQSKHTFSMSAIQNIRCHQSWFSNTIETQFECENHTVRFHGQAGIELWALLDSFKHHCELLHHWNDKQNWWTGSSTIILLEDSLRCYRIPRLKAVGSLYSVTLDDVHTIDFGKSILALETSSGRITIGQRHRTNVYKSITEKILDTMCHSFEQGLVGFWDSERKVHLGILTLDEDTLSFTPKNPNHARIEHKLSELWMPDLYDANKSFIQIRVPSNEPTPKWIVIHCGKPAVAQQWVSVLNLPSKRILWSDCSPEERIELLHLRQAILHHSDLAPTPIDLAYNNDILSIQTSAKSLPLESSIELWFDDGQRKFRLTTEIEYKQDIPVAQWILHPPKRLDSYNFRAHHRTQVDWEAQFIPIYWNSQNGWLPNPNRARLVTMKDLSYTGCALEMDGDTEDAEFWMLQVLVPSRTLQIIGQVRYQRKQPVSNLWRIGFQFTSRQSQAVREMFSTIATQQELQEIEY